MKNVERISAHDKEAAQYDQQVREYDCYAHDVLFGMCFEYVNPHECLLDLGIGTGLASLPFAKLGLEVFGCDGSAEMLKVCESKTFATELKVLDLLDTPLPYSDDFFNHVISCGVFHFLSELDPIIKEILRVMKPEGIFAFTVAAHTIEEELRMGDNLLTYSEVPTPWGVSIFIHSDGYIISLLQAHSFDILKTQKLLIRGGPEDKEDLLFKAYVTQQTGAVSST